MTLDLHTQVVGDLNYLQEAGALAGVAEVIRERRRQIEQLGYGAAHDAAHADGFLVSEASAETTAAIVCVAEGLAGPAEVERNMAKAGALCAAEIDRLGLLLEPGDPRAD